MENVARVRNITDLAHLAGVSPGTVSRALADSHLIAREHDFRPNALARNLRTRRTGAIAVVIPLAQHGKPQPRDSECLSLLAPISAALCARDYDLLLLTADGIDPRWLIRLADSGRCDGILLLGYAELHGALEDDAIWCTRRRGISCQFAAAPNHQLCAAHATTCFPSGAKQRVATIVAGNPMSISDRKQP